MRIKLLFVLIIWFVCVFTAPLQIFGAWQKQNSNTFAWLHSIYFADAENGFAVGANGTLLTTADAGATWRKTQVSTKDNLRDIAFTNLTDGWILAERDEYNLKPKEARSYLLRTADAGKTWRKVEFANNTLNSQFVRFIVGADKQKIWAIGSTGAFYLLEKNAAAWQKQPPPTDYLLLGGWLSNQRSGGLLAANGSVLTTADAGATWRETTVSKTGKPRLNAAFFVDARAGWIVGANGKIFAAANGVGWREQNSGVAADLLDVRFVGVSEGWAAGDAGTLLRTVDAGATWTLEDTAGKTTRRLERLFFVKTADRKTRGWAVGFGGTILTYAE